MRRPTVEDPQAATQAAPRSRDPSARSALDHARERTRGWIALALLAPLPVGVLIAVLALVFGKLTVAELKELFASLNLSTIIGLAMGFYFGRSTK
jgi:hypothetical protein